MEYYDSINKTELQIFYMNKSSKLLQNQKVVELLDKKIMNLDELGDIQLFETNPYQIVRKVNGRRSMSNQDLPIVSYNRTMTETSEKRKNSLDERNKKQQDKILIKIKTQQEVEDLDSKLDKLSSNITIDISSQMSKFEEMKKRKLEQQMNSNKSKNSIT